MFLLGGFLFQFWPFFLIAIVALGLGGYYIPATALGIVLDITFGVPGGILRFIWFPFTAGALLIVALHMASLHYMLPRTAREKL